MMKLHEPVLLSEVIESLHIKNQGRYIDATLGAGGYTKEISKNGGIVLGMDADNSMLTIARENLKGAEATLVNGNFRDIKRIATENGFTEVDGIVFDLGVSNVHFSDMERGFSFKNPGADLDMRLNPSTQQVKASDLLNMLRIDQLSQMFGKKLAKGIEEFRETKKFQTVGDFLSLFPEKRVGKLHPATKAFLALRIAVNSELENLMAALPQAYELLKPGGILAVVSFHSQEDEIVKDFMRSKGKKTEPIRPTAEEVSRNPKSRSAILRFTERK